MFTLTLCVSISRPKKNTYSVQLVFASPERIHEGIFVEYPEATQKRLFVQHGNQ